MSTKNPNGKGGTATKLSVVKPELSNVVVSTDGTTTDQEQAPKLEKTEEPESLVNKVIQMPATQAEAKPLPSLADRLKKLEELQNLVEKRERLVEHLDNIKKFDYSSPNANPTVKFTDSANGSFTFSNAAVIAECVKLAKTRLESQIAEIEGQISFYF